jgi:FkbM family methyltransferase
MSAGTLLQRALARLAAALDRAGAGRVPGVRRVWALLHRAAFRGGERCVVANGMPIWIDTRDRVIAARLVGDGVWEPEETAAFVAHVGPGMCVFDVGANVGYYTLLAARAVGASGRVFAFEPEPRNFALLSRSVAGNGFVNVRLHNAAVSSGPGSARLHLDDANFGAHSFELGSVRTSSGRSVEVDAVALDGFLEEARDSAAGILVKIDVQGAEALVVEGARGLLALPRVTVFLELWPEALERSGADPARLLDDLAALGFAFEDVGAPAAARRPLGREEILAACRTRAQAWMNLLLTKARGKISP